MKRFELSMRVLDKEYVDTLIVSLVHQGYDIYYNAEEGVVCMTIDESELIEIKG